ncbi:30S ribosomal protein S4 [[Eubacterium] cellulosolvens]
MGDPKKQRKKYETPRHPWRRDQLDVELRLMGEYGLRNKRELWRYKTMLSEMRGIARSLLAKSGSEREEAEQAFLTRLRRMGLAGEATSVDDTLDLDIRNLLERRLQSIVFRGGLAGSPSQARQLITHGHIAVGDHVVSVPGYLVSRADEDRVRYAAESAIAKSDHPARKALSRVEVATQSSPGRGPRKSAA